MTDELIRDSIGDVIAVRGHREVVKSGGTQDGIDAVSLAVGVHRCAAALERIAAAMEARGEVKP